MKHQDGNAVMIYWEPQVAGLCGAHCLNTLLQSPIISAPDLADIALRLDALEKVAMAEDGTTTNEFLKFMAEDSGNVAGDGNFSVQVLSEALKVWGLEVVSLTSSDEVAKQAKADPLQQQAFICNLGAHWFTVRKIEGVWWNLNSLNKKGPEEVSDLYLTLLFKTLTDEGYSIFVVVGDFPSFGMNESFQGSGKWMAMQPRAYKGSPAAQTQGFVGGTGDALEDAIKASLQQEDDDLMAQAIAASLAQEESNSNANNNACNDEDQALAFSRFLSVPEPDEGGDNFVIQIRVPGKMLKRNFLPDTAVSSLYDWILTENNAKGVITTEYPHKEHPSSSNTLAKEFEGLGKRLALNFK